MSCCKDTCDKCTVIVLGLILATICAFATFVTLGGLDKKLPAPIRAEKAE